MYAKLVKAPKRREHRRHSEEFKRQVVEACRQPGVSMAAIALANGLNANMVRRWVKDHGDGGLPALADATDRLSATSERRPTLVPIAVSTPVTAPTGEIRIEIHRQQTLIQVAWPVSQAAACAEWLREILK